MTPDLPGGGSRLILIRAEIAAEAAMATAQAAGAPGGGESCVVLLLDAADWRRSAVLRAYTQRAALALAPWGVRVNAIERDDRVTEEELSRAVAAVHRLASMTGNCLRLRAAAAAAAMPV